MNQDNINTTRVIVLDDDEDTRFAIARILKKCGCSVTEVDSVSAALSIMEQGSTDLVISDMRIPGSDGGEELLEIAGEKFPEIHIVLMSCAMGEDVQASLLEKGATACLQKPFFKDDCIELLEFIDGQQRKSA